MPLPGSYHRADGETVPAATEADDFERQPGHAPIHVRAPRVPLRVAIAVAVAAAAAAVVAIVTLAHSPAIADPMHATGVPPPRQSAAMAYDSVAGETVMYGGHGITSDLYDTWVWNGSWWTQLNVTDGPRVSSPALTDDPADGGVLLVGTLNPLSADRAAACKPVATPCSLPAASATTQTWLFRSGRWQQLTDVGDQPRTPVTMATVPSTSAIVAVGDATSGNCATTVVCPLTPTPCNVAPIKVVGCIDGARVSTWYWSGRRWVADTQVLDLYSILVLVPSTNVGALDLVSVVAPPIPSCIEASSNCPVKAAPPRSWHWSGAAWVADPASTNLPPLQSGLVADAGSRSALVVPNGQSWVLSDGVWVELPGTTPTTPRFGAAFAIDHNGNWVLFGGTTPTGGDGNDTWLLVGDTWHHVSGSVPSTALPVPVAATAMRPPREAAGLALRHAGATMPG